MGPDGVGLIPEAADEYDCLIPDLAAMVHDGASQEEISLWLQGELKSHFGLSPRPEREDEVARAIVAWGISDDASQLRWKPLGADDLRLVLARVLVDDQDNGELPMVAAWALAGGVESPSLAELAGQSGDDVRECRDLFIAAMGELGVQLPAADEGWRAMARYWAREMVAGILTPYEASRLIWWKAWGAGNRPDDLTVFVGLASDWEDHPEDRSELERQMMNAARRLAATEEAT